MSPWAKKAAVAIGALVLALLWTNSRILMLRRSQDPARPTVLSAYYVYHEMAVSLGEGRPGQMDLGRYTAALENPLVDYPVDRGTGSYVPYYALDIGYSFLVQLGRLAFPTLPDTHLRALALQLLCDAPMVGFVYFLFHRWHPLLGWAAALLYVANKVFIQLGAVAFYYYWDVPLCISVLGMLLLASARPGEGARWLVLAGAGLGFGVWLRASWWPLTALFFAVAATSRELRRRLLPAFVVFAILATPQLVRSSVARGYPALSTRATWHVALVGLGYYPNAHGFDGRDESVFRLMQQRYGVSDRLDDYGPEDRAARGVYLDILRRDPAFVLRSFLGRLWESLSGTTIDSMAPYLGVPQAAYRAACLAGLVLMIRRGGDRRLVGVAAAGAFLLYTGVTSLFYFVGLAYDNVSQVGLFVLFVGLLDSVLGRFARPGPGAPVAPTR